LIPVLATKDFQRTTLKARHRPVVRALAEAFFSPDGEVSDEKLDRFIDNVDGFISPMSKTLRFGLMLLLFAIQWSPLLYGRFRAFSEMKNEDRIHHLEKLEASRFTKLSLLVVSYKTLLTMLFYEDPDELKALGYPGSERKRYLRLAR
jgi:hypothetical protein